MYTQEFMDQLHEDRTRALRKMAGTRPRRRTRRKAPRDARAPTVTPIVHDDVTISLDGVTSPEHARR